MNPMFHRLDAVSLWRHHTTQRLRDQVNLFATTLHVIGRWSTQAVPKAVKRIVSLCGLALRLYLSYILYMCSGHMYTDSCDAFTEKRTFTQFWSGRSMACSSVDVLDWQVGNGWHIKNWYLRTGNWPESRKDNQLSSILLDEAIIRISCNLCVTKKGWYHGFSANTPIGTAVIFIAVIFFF